MSGYYGFSKSNNAVAAEQDGLFPASRVAKMHGVSAQAVREVLSPAEWHHTSSWYNETDYYRSDLSEEEIAQLNEAEARLRQRRAMQAPVYYAAAKIAFVVFEGTRSRPRPRDVELTAPAVVLGGWVTIYESSKPMRKKMSARSFRSLSGTPCTKEEHEAAVAALRAAEEAHAAAVEAHVRELRAAERAEKERRDANRVAEIAYQQKARELLDQALATLRGEDLEFVRHYDSLRGEQRRQFRRAHRDRLVRLGACVEQHKE